MAKMFVHYNGSVDSFKKIANYASTYNNSIVFISGVEGEGAAIYTHGKFYANIKDVQDLAGQLAGLKIIKGIKVDGTERVATNHDGIIEFKAADNATVTIEGTSTGIKIGLDQAFVNRVTDAEAAIAKEVEDRGKEITRVEGVVSGINGRVTAIEGNTDDPASANSIHGAKKYADEAAAAVIGTNGDAAGASTIFGAKAYADNAVAVEAGLRATAEKNITDRLGVIEGDGDGSIKKAEANAKAYADGLKAAIDAAYTQADTDTLAAAKAHADNLVKDTEGKSRFDAAGSAAAVQGNLNTEVSRAKAAEEANANAIAVEKARMDAFLAEATISEAAVDTLKEIQAYITSDGAAAQEMLAAIEAARGAADTAQDEVDALEGVVAGVKATAEAAATKVALKEEIDRAKGAEQNLQAAINVINGTEAGSISKAVKDAKDIIDAYTVNGKAISTNPVLGAADIKVSTDKTVAQAISALETAVGEGGSVDSKISTAIQSLNSDATSSDGSHVTVKVTAVAGKLTAVNVTESDIASKKDLDDLIVVVDKKVNKTDYEAKVTELEAMWAWEEL